MHRVLLLAVMCLAIFIPQAQAADHLSLMGVHTSAPGVPVAVIDNSFRTDLANTTFISGSSSQDPFAHGTLMSLAINGPATTSVASQTPLLTYGCAQGDNVELFCAASAVDDAISRGVKVISLSFGKSTMSEVSQNVWREKIARAQAEGVVIFASGGEESTLYYPAALDGIISVSVQGHNNGAQMQLPGTDLLTYAGDGTQTYGRGSSFATAYAAGLAARLFKAGATAAQIQSVMHQNVRLDTAASTLGLPGFASVQKPAKVSLVEGTFFQYYKRTRVTWKRSAAMKVCQVKVANKIYTATKSFANIRTPKKPSKVLVRCKTSTWSAWSSGRVYKL